MTNVQNKTFCKVAHGVTFDFMKSHVNELIFKEFDLRTVEKINPFYGCISKNLSSLVYSEINEDYRRKDSNEHSKSLNFLNNFTLYFREGQNAIDFYYRVQSFKDKIKNIGNLFWKLMTEDKKKSFRDSDNP